MKLLRALDVRRAERRSPRRLALVGLALLVAGCGGGEAGRLVMPVTLGGAPTAAAPRYPDDFRSHEAVVRNVGALLARDLGLPVPEEVTAYVYSSRGVFERGLVDDGRLPVVRAAELSEFAIGVGKRRQLLLYDERGQPAARAWLRLVAHELTHVAQIELAQGEGHAEQWLAEGMAEWAAFAVLERLGLDYLADERAIALSQVREHPALRRGRIDLVSLGTPRGFTVRHLREGSRSTYQLAFLMTDYLVRRHGLEALTGYFRAFAEGRGRRESFRLAFGRGLEEFEREVLAHFERVLR